MSWDFETDPDFREKLDWADEFVRTDVEPVDHVVENPYDLTNPIRRALIPPLQAEVRAHGLWAAHLGPELGGSGYGQLKLALLNEILGRSHCAPIVFGCQAPDSGNAEILARYGTEEQKRRYLQPLLDNEIVSCFSMTEPQGGADPKVLTTSAELDGDGWTLNGEKWFSSNAAEAAFFIVMAVTDPEREPYERMSMFIVPAETPGVRIVREVGLALEPIGTGNHPYVCYENVRVPPENLLGPRGGAFVVAQTRLGGGRIHHAMRTIGVVKRMLEMMCERALSRTTQGELLGRKQLVQEMIADSWLDIEQYRLLTLQTAWKIDRYGDYKRVRGDIAAVKALMPKVCNAVATRALQIHGSLGISNEMPFVGMLVEGLAMGLADGPTEVHKLTLARELLRDAEPSDDLFPRGHLPRLRAAAEARYADVLREAYTAAADPP